MGINPYTNWHRQSKPARSIVPIARFVSEFDFALKNGGFGRLFSLEGIDEESLTAPLIDAVVARVHAAVRNLPEGGRLYQYARIRRGFDIPRQPSYDNPKVERLIADRIQFLDETAGFRRLDLFWCLTVEPTGPKRNKLNPAAFAAESNRLIASLQRAASTLAVQLADTVGLRALDKHAAFSFFSYLLNLEEHSADRKLLSDERVDAQLVGSAVAWRDDRLRIGQRHVRMFSLLSNPAAARPNLFRSLLRIDCDLVLCSSWVPQSRDKTAGRVKSIEQFQAIFANSLFAMAANARNPENLEKTAGAKAATKGTDNLASILHSIDDEGHRFGKYSLIGMVHSRNPEAAEEAIALVTKSLVDVQAPAIEETVGSLSAYYAILPGNSSGNIGSNFNVRQFWLRDDHHAVMSLVFAPDLGRTYSEDLEAEYLNVFETRSGSPYFLDPYVNGMRTLLVLGAPRTGKSVHGNQAIAHEVKYGGFVYIVDIGGSYESIVLYYGGSVVRMGGASRPRINPFSLQPTESNLAFLFGFVRILLTKAGAKLEPQDDDVIDRAVRSMYVIEHPAYRRLKYFNLPPHLDRYLRKWKEGGVYGAVFDNEEDSLRLSRIQAFDFEGVTEDQKDVIEPLLFWILRQINDVIHDRDNLGVPKHIVFDELWKQLENRQLLETVLSALKTGGKHLAGATLLTQSAEDLGVNADLIVNACASKLFLPDPTFNRGRYQQLFQLNEQEVANLASLNRAEHEALLKHGETPAKIIRLNLDPKTYAMFSSKPKDRLARAKALEEHGDRAYDFLASAGD